MLSPGFYRSNLLYQHVCRIKKMNLSFDECSGLLTFITGIVSRPHAKNSKNITTKAWYTLGSPIPELCGKKIKSIRIGTWGCKVRHNWQKSIVSSICNCKSNQLKLAGIASYSTITYKVIGFNSFASFRRSY